jgi:hypothetical protein
MHIIIFTNPTDPAKIHKRVLLEITNEKILRKRQKMEISEYHVVKNKIFIHFIVLLQF